MKNQFPIRFSLLVNGKRQITTLETMLAGQSFNIFSIKFADGYHDCFYDNGDGTIRSINQEKGKLYAGALRHDLYVFNNLAGGETQLDNFSYEVDGQFANGWVLKQLKNAELTFTVYLKGVYQFDIVEKENGWTAVVQNSEGRKPIDTKLANYAFNSVTSGSKKHPVEEPEGSAVPAKPVEFPLQFNYDGSQIEAHGLLMDTRPWQQCTVAVPTGNIQQPLDRYDFFKVDNPGKLFTWLPDTGKREKISRAISQELDKTFDVKRRFAVN